MALFENYDRRLAKINAVLSQYGIGSVEECREICKEKGPRYLELTEGYVTRIALNADSEIVGYEFVSLGKMMDFIKKGDDANEAMKKATGHYGQWDNAAKYIDPRQE